MARKKQSEKPKKNAIPNAYIAGAGIVEEEKITDTLVRKYQNSSRTGAGIGDAEQKCF